MADLHGVHRQALFRATFLVLGSGIPRNAKSGPDTRRGLFFLVGRQPAGLGAPACEERPPLTSKDGSKADSLEFNDGASDANIEQRDPCGLAGYQRRESGDPGQRRFDQVQLEPESEMRLRGDRSLRGDRGKRQ